MFYYQFARPEDMGFYWDNDKIAVNPEGFAAYIVADCDLSYENGVFYTYYLGNREEFEPEFVFNYAAQNLKGYLPDLCTDGTLEKINKAIVRIAQRRTKHGKKYH